MMIAQRFRTADGLTRTTLLLVMSPLCVAALLMLASSVILSGTADGTMPGVILGAAAVALMAAAGLGWIALDQAVSIPLRALAEGLRDMRAGRPWLVPPGLRGSMRDIAVLAAEIVKSAGAAPSLDAMERAAQTIGRLAGAAQAEQTAVTRSLRSFSAAIRDDTRYALDSYNAGLTGHLEKIVTAALARQHDPAKTQMVLEVILKTVSSKMDQVIAQALTKHAATDTVTSELESLRRRMDVASSESKSMMAAIEAMRRDIKTGSGVADDRPEKLLGLMQRLDAGLAEARSTLTAVRAGLPQTNGAEARLLQGFNDLRQDVLRQFRVAAERDAEAANATESRPEPMGNLAALHRLPPEPRTASNDDPQGSSGAGRPAVFPNWREPLQRRTDLRGRAVDRSMGLVQAEPSPAPTGVGTLPDGIVDLPSAFLRASERANAPERRAL